MNQTLSTSLSTPLAAQRHRHWLVAAALPLWAHRGVDLERGGFFEKVGFDLRPVAEPRRARVVARQIYVFATAQRRGWLDGADALVEHGLSFLLNLLRQQDGSFAAAVEPDGRVVRGEFDLYEHAFVLFALASACRDRPDRSALAAEARTLLGCMHAHWKHPVAGFEEASPRRLPLLSNPHMHLMEAALEWEDVAPPSDRPVWAALADELAQLCLECFIDAKDPRNKEKPEEAARGRAQEWISRRKTHKFLPGLDESVTPRLERDIFPSSADLDALRRLETADQFLDFLHQTRGRTRK